jgi:hypothetical protein
MLSIGVEIASLSPWRVGTALVREQIRSRRVTRADRMRLLLIGATLLPLVACAVLSAPPHGVLSQLKIRSFGLSSSSSWGADSLGRLVRSVAPMPNDQQDTGDSHPYCPRRSESPAASRGEASTDALKSPPQGQPGREAGPQGNGSLVDRRASEATPSADTPNPLTLSPGDAACKGS